jgi:hypothetical protein
VSQQTFDPDSWAKPGVPWTGRRWRAFRAGWWRQRAGSLGRLLRRSRADMPKVKRLVMPSLLSVHEPSDTFTIQTPAMGDAFSFHVRVRCSWCVQATATEEERKAKTAEVREFIEKSRETTRLRIEERIRPLARAFPPYRAAEAEEEINKTIADCLNDGDVQVKVQAWVDVCDPVREDLQKVWRQRLVVDADGDMKKAHVELLTALQKAWQKLLLTGLKGIGAVPEGTTDWLAPYALALAEDPKNAAGYLKAALEGRVDYTQQLLTDLGALVLDERSEEIEFVLQTDSALRSLLMYLGVPIPSKNGGTPDANHA